MNLVSLSFENYKAFPGSEKIEIRPLTILIGKNSSGKSVISRLPLLLGRSLSQMGSSPFELAFEELDYGASTVDLIHNRIPHGALAVGAGFVEENQGSLDVWAKVQHFDEYKLQQITTFRANRLGMPTLTLSWVGGDPAQTTNRYRVEETGEELRVSFWGLIPRDLEPAAGSAVSEVVKMWQSTWATTRTQISVEMGLITYLGPFRNAPARYYRFIPGSIRNVGFSGRHTAALLAEDHLRHGGDVLEAVGNWFEKNLGGWKLGISVQEEVFSLFLSQREQPSVRINLADVGTGIAQVLPIVVQRQFDIIAGRAPALEIVEQPELHLHPGAHGDLADLYIDTVNHCGMRFIVETHSENFILRLRRRVAESKLDPDRVRIYWVTDNPRDRSKIMPIEISQNGEVSVWPSGVFSEDFAEVRGIRIAQKGA